MRAFGCSEGGSTLRMAVVCGWLAAVTAMAGCAASPPAPETILPGPPLAAIRYTIQAGAFSSSARAAAHEEKLAADGIDAYYFIDTDRLYKVRFGRFETRAAAAETAERLLARGVIDDYYIVRPRPTTPHAASTPEVRARLVTTARRFIGTPYQWGGTSAAEGFDCSGLTMAVYRLNGLELPRTARAQYQAGAAVPRGALQAGDLVFFRTGGFRRITHVGIYSGGGRFIHAPGSGKTIGAASLTDRYYRQRYAGARRYF